MNFSVKSIYNWYRNTIRNPQYRWWIILGTLVYLISPIDISPDIFPIAGQIDDIMILTLLITEMSQLVFDYAKSRKVNTVSPTEEASSETIDVEAVSVD
ncbi:MAG: YkvA family protein [Xenococcaceae cyanobacterium]